LEKIVVKFDEIAKKKIILYFKSNNSRFNKALSLEGVMQ
jgi:hypothetical protein